MQFETFSGGPDRIADSVLFRSGVLGASTCARPHFTEPTLRAVRMADKSAQIKDASTADVLYLAGPTGFEPAIFSVTGRRDRPLHYEPNICFVAQGA